MPDRILILERDRADPAVWSYGLADAEGRLPELHYRLRHSPTTGSEPISDHHEMLWPTVVLLVRRAGRRDRVCLHPESGPGRP